MEERSWERLRPAYLDALGFAPSSEAVSTPFPESTPAPVVATRPDRGR